MEATTCCLSLSDVPYSRSSFALFVFRTGGLSRPGMSLLCQIYLCCLVVSMRSRTRALPAGLLVLSFYSQEPHSAIPSQSVCVVPACPKPRIQVTCSSHRDHFSVSHLPNADDPMYQQSHSKWRLPSFTMCVLDVPVLMCSLL